MNPRVSIILPTYQGEAHLRRLLPVLQAQRYPDGIEIRAVDSSSRDASGELLERAGALWTRIPQAEFGHGRTRNACARAARGEFLVFLSQDALPRDEHFVAELVRAFDDPRVAGAQARILPHPDDDALTARTALDAPEARAEARTLERGDARAASFNNVASAIRRSVFEKLPFPDVEFGEDSAWAELALMQGHKIRFVPEAVVFHAHRYGMRAAFARYRVDAAFQRAYRGRVVRPSLASVARGVLHEVARDAGYVARHPGAFLQLLRSPFLRTAQVLGQYAGSRAIRENSA